MKQKKALICLFCLMFFAFGYSQEKRKFKIHTVAFYNLENLFDTINDPNKFDEFSPIMEINYNRSRVYESKVKNIARVISEIGEDVSHNSPVIIGVAEVENRKVLEDLCNDERLISTDYGIIHYDSPDARGIDVALLYQKAVFTPIDHKSYELKIYDDETRERVYTRDQLLVSGNLDGELVHFIVSHWPSRRGGEARSKPKRIAAAKLNKQIIDSLQSIDPYAKIFTMGDLNDDPTNTSVKEILKSERKKKKVGIKGIYNPMENFARQGLGTNAYRDSWSLFDQILFTQPLLDQDYSSYRFYKAGIFNKSYLTNKKGRWRGYPLRSFADGAFTNGYSDHFPVYITLIKEVQ